MPYLEGRTYYDADSHVMELNGWLPRYADPDVRELLRPQAGAEMFLFSTDYPHPEGGRDPLKRFENSMAGVSVDAKERFYSRNFAEMMGTA
jgi:uncharacterized protein